MKAYVVTMKEKIAKDEEVQDASLTNTMVLIDELIQYYGMDGATQIHEQALLELSQVEVEVTEEIESNIIRKVAENTINWNALTEEAKAVIIASDSMMVHTQEITFYKNNKMVASAGISHVNGQIEMLNLFTTEGKVWDEYQDETDAEALNAILKVAITNAVNLNQDAKTIILRSGDMRVYGEDVVFYHNEKSIATGKVTHNKEGVHLLMMWDGDGALLWEATEEDNTVPIKFIIENKHLKGIIYTAHFDSNEFMNRVTWLDNGKEQQTFYASKMIDKLLEDGTWTVLHCPSHYIKTADVKQTVSNTHKYTVRDLLITRATVTAVAMGYKVIHDRFPKVTTNGVWLKVTKRKNGVTGKAMRFDYGGKS